MRWKLFLFLVIVMVYSSLAYADFGYNNPNLPKLVAPIITSTTNTNVTIYNNNTNITTNNYFINQSVGGWINDSTNTNTSLNVNIFGDLHTNKTVYFEGGSYSDCGRLTTNIAGMIVCAGMELYALISDVNAWILGNKTNYTSDEIYINKNSSNSFNLNETKLNSTIDSKLATTYYNVTTNYVPYQGATANLNLSRYNLTVNYTCFNPTCSAYMYYNGSVLITKVN